MEVSRRDFIKYCGAAAASIGLSTVDLGQLEKALANPNGPSVIWLQGSACAGCSISLLNRVSTYSPATATEVLTNSINLIYHPVLMAVAGDSAVAAAKAVYDKGNYILVVEGGVPTAFGGHACIAWSYKGLETTFLDVVKKYAAKASKILCVGTCASFGGIPASSMNPTAIKTVKAVTGKQTINIAGCPTHPDWIVWAVVQLLLGRTIKLDSDGRPSSLFNGGSGSTVHAQCPRNGTTKATKFGMDGYCLMNLGCRGPGSHATCPSTKWNGGTNWCVQANAPCLGCVEPTFPGTKAFYAPKYRSDDGEGNDD